MVRNNVIRGSVVLLLISISACAPKIELNIDQTSLIPKEIAAQYLQSYDWVPANRITKTRELCGPFSEETLEGYPYEALTVTYLGGPFQATIRRDDGEPNYPVCHFVMQGQPGFGASEADLERAKRFTQAFMSLGGKYEFSGF